MKPVISGEWKNVKQILNWMALYKLNRFHWHLTDSQGWRIEIKKLSQTSSHWRNRQLWRRIHSCSILHTRRNKWNRNLCSRTKHPHYTWNSSIRDMHLLLLKHIQNLAVAVLLNILDIPFNPRERISVYTYLTDILKGSRCAVPLASNPPWRRWSTLW